VVYRCEPVHQFNEFTALCKPIEEKQFLEGSLQFSVAAKIENESEVEIDLDGLKIKRKFRSDKNFKGTIGEISLFDSILHNNKLLSKYRYFRAKISSDGSMQ